MRVQVVAERHGAILAASLRRRGAPSGGWGSTTRACDAAGGRREAFRAGVPVQGGRRHRCVGEGPAMTGRARTSRRVRRPCARLGSHPRASAGPLLRLDDRPILRMGIDDASLRCRRRPTRDVSCRYAGAGRPSASLRRRGAGNDRSCPRVTSRSPALRSSRVASPRERGAPASPRRPPHPEDGDRRRELAMPQAADTRGFAPGCSCSEAAHAALRPPRGLPPPAARRTGLRRGGQSVKNMPMG